MSTNYYFRVSEGPLAACAPLHIGKTSGGWQFHFQGYLEEGGLKTLEVSRLGALHIQVLVPRLMIRSLDDWLEFLDTTPGVILNEYGEELPVERFKQLVRSHGPGCATAAGKLLANHVDYLASNASVYGPVNVNKDWKDPQGYAFTTVEFS